MIFTIFVISCIIASIVFSIIGEYCIDLIPVIIILSASISQWFDFTANTPKLTKHNHVISDLDRILSWWKQLTSGEKKSSEN